MPLIAGCKQRCVRHGLRALAAGTEDPGVQFEQGAGEPGIVLSRGTDGDVEVLREPLSSVGLDRDSADRHVLDTVACERREQLARVEPAGVAHLPGSVCRDTASRPARSSAATAFQLMA